jgi:ABC-type polar amino acid transport system ATPase subunit
VILLDEPTSGLDPRTTQELWGAVQDGMGIRRAQDVISSTLANHHGQYEAIQPQRAVATSGRNNPLAYLPREPAESRSCRTRST